MGRSNNSARARNRRMNRREKGEPRQAPKQQHIPRPSLESLIIPDGRCFRNPRRPKVKWATEQKAKAALQSAQADAARMGHTHAETRYYACPEAEGGCGGFHLTSRESYTPRSTS